MQKSLDTVEIKLFNESSDMPPETFVFQPDEHSVSIMYLQRGSCSDSPIQAKKDIPLVRKLVIMVESTFKNGVPLHRQPAASKTEYTGQSSIFTIDYKAFSAMQPLDIQGILRYRHILVTGVDPGREIKFDAEGLGILADIDQQEVIIQRMCPLLA